ncbi:MAG: NAD(P)/FAD-dependent oxidoreductase [Chloroflexota bacterium]
MANQFDVIIVGGGHNGLVAAATLAQEGQRVLVLEQRPVLGGAAANEEVFPGFHINTGADDAGLFFDEISQRLGLPSHGLAFTQGQALLFAPQPDGQALTIWRDPAATTASIAQFSQHDAEQFPAFKSRVERMAAVLHDMALLPPPDLNELQFNTLSDLIGIGLRRPELRAWGNVALKAKRLGDEEMMEFIRVLPLAAQTYLDEWFESNALKGALGGSAVTGLTLGPRSSGTTLMFLYQAMHGLLNSRYVVGGIGRLSEALADKARSNGAVIRTGAPVESILVAGDLEQSATGVRLADGEEIRAAAVLSNVDPRRTLFGLVGPQQLDPEVMRQVRNIIYRGSTAKINLALDSLPDFNGQTSTEQLTGRIRISPSLNYLERAYDAAKYGQYSSAPYLDMVIPTLHDPTLAPDGQHILSITVQFAPYALRDTDWSPRRKRSPIQSWIQSLYVCTEHSPAGSPLPDADASGLGANLRANRRSITHGHMGLDQLLVMRPIPGWSQYRTPIRNLYLCGAGTHPGGGVTGVPGYHAARSVLGRN